MSQVAGDSVVLGRCARPDRYDVQAVPLPAGVDLEPGEWAEEIFDLRRTSPVVKVLLGLRQLLVPLIGVPRTRGNPFAVSEVSGDEAVIATSERHLDFWCGIRQRRGMLEVATAVTFHGWRGRLYFAPVGLLHGPVTRTMMRRAVQRQARDGSALGRRGRQDVNRSPEAG